jgi:membrane fusion protein, multidrug efflux system
MTSAPLRLWPAALIALALAASAGCNRTPPIVEMPPAPVSVSTVVEDFVTDYDEFNGRTASSKEVKVTPRVTGYLTEVAFASGAFVQEGQVLFRIDPSIYRAELDKAQGDLVVAQANLVKSKDNYERELKIFKDNPGATSEKTITDLKAKYDEAVGNVKRADGSRDAARQYLEWTEVKSPIAGKASNNFLDVGNLVTQDKSELTTVVALDPIWVYFDVDERTMMVVKALIREDKVRPARPPVDLLAKNFMAWWGLKALKGGDLTAMLSAYATPPFPLAMRLVTEQGFPNKGVIDFVDNRVNPTTGTIRVRGSFPNKQFVNKYYAITPGQFAMVRMPIGVKHKALLVSDRAVAQDQTRKYVLVVNDKNVVEERDVELGQKHHGLRVVEKGLRSGDRVIVSGLQRARAGATVAPQLVAMPGFVRDEDWGVADAGGEQ